MGRGGSIKNEQRSIYRDGIGNAIAIIYHLSATETVGRSCPVNRRQPTSDGRTHGVVVGRPQYNNVTTAI